MKRHTLDTVSLIFGIIFIAVGLTFAIAQEPWEFLAIDLNWSWLGPVVLLGLGAVVLLPLFRAGSRETAGPVTETLPEEVVSAMEELPPDPLD